MIKNYIKIAIRNLRRYKMYSLINILGLAVGLATVFIIAIYLKYELSFDRFIEDSDKIKRVVSVIERDDTHLPYTAEEVAEKTRASIPEIRSATKIYNAGILEVQYKNKTAGEFKSVFTDQHFFDVFSFTRLEGDVKRTFDQENRVIITRDMKEMVFGNDEAVHKILHFEEENYVIVGVVENVPDNFHFQFDMLISFPSLSEQTRTSNAFDYPTYLRFKQEPDSIIEKKTTDYISGVLDEKFSMFDFKISSYLQPLKDIHFSSGLERDYAVQADKQQIYIFSIIALFILLIAVFNFLNLFTAQSENRLKEVGIRKVIGSKRKQLIFQFIGESLLIGFIAFLIAMLLVETFLPEFFSLIQVDFSFSYGKNWFIIGGFFLFTILVGIVSAWYPALYVSSFNPVRIFGNNLFRGQSKGFFRTALVITQFTISVGLITSIVIFYSQVHYMKNKDMGFDKEGVANIYGFSSLIESKYESIKEELMRNPKIHSVTASMVIPTNARSPMNLRLPGQQKEEAFNCEENRVQPGYVDTYGLTLLKGKDFTEPHSKEDIIINETAAKRLGLENPIGEEVIVWRRRCRIIGLVKDYNFRSLHKEIGPLVLSHYYDLKYIFSVKANGDFNKETLAYIEKVMKSYDPAYNLKYRFIDERISSLYRKEERLNKLIFVASVIGIILSVIGLYAFIALMLNKRLKEMGVRKVFGASSKKILMVVFRLVFKWILISSILGWIIAYFFASDWLNNFPYRINPEPWMFLSSFIIVGLLAGLAVIRKIYIVAKVSPVKILRYE